MEDYDTSNGVHCALKKYGGRKMSYITTGDVKDVINFIRDKKITKFYVLVDLLIDSDDDYLLDIIVEYIDFFELYFEDLN